MKILDRIGVGSIEVEGIESSKVDSLRIKSIASLVKNSTLAVPVKMDDDSIQAAWNAAKGAKHVRLQVEAAVSPSCMEYIQRKKADTLIADAAEAVAKCAQLTDDVEFVAIDATRTDVAYLARVIDAVVVAGAKTVTVCDAAGSMLPEEFAQFIADLYQAAPQLKDIDLGISCCNNLNMADACAVAGVMAGASIVKATSYPMGVVALDNVARILAAKADALGAQSKVRVTELKRAMNQISRLCCDDRSKASLFTGAVSRGRRGRGAHRRGRPGHRHAVRRAPGLQPLRRGRRGGVRGLQEDRRQQGARERHRAGRHRGLRRAAGAPTYPGRLRHQLRPELQGHLAHLAAQGRRLIEAVSLGDGPIDSSFKSIESVVGKHYELDDFSIQAVTEGREAMGESVVKLIADGKVYSGRGISTDIVESSIRAYINALNKIAYEEQN